MKNLIFILGLGVLFTACSGEDAEPTDNNTDPVNGNNVLLLKVDHVTNAFEGGREIEFDSTESFTISHEYEAPGDFGSIKLLFDELDAPIFDGTIVWAGLGEMTYPAALEPAESFNVMDNEVEMPALSQFSTVEYIEEGEGALEPDHQLLWDAIDHLQIVEDYRLSNPEAKVHLFLYTPSVGIGDPAEWDWFIIMKN